MTDNNIVSNDREAEYYAELLQCSEKQILILILSELKAMRQQEKDYWDTWKKAKQAEQNKEIS